MKNPSNLILHLLLTFLVGGQLVLADQEKSASSVVEVTPREAAALLRKDPTIVVVDVRTAKEFAKGHLSGGLNLDVNGRDFKGKLAQLDRSKSYLLHCRSGFRSGKSLALWKELGFRKVYHLKAGFLGWTEAELPVNRAE